MLASASVWISVTIINRKIFFLAIIWATCKLVMRTATGGIGVSLQLALLYVSYSSIRQ